MFTPSERILPKIACYYKNMQQSIRLHDFFHLFFNIYDVIEHTGFQMIIPDEVEQIEEPTQEELTIMRTEVDPKGYYLK